jgi:hypothetical protein
VAEPDQTRTPFEARTPTETLALLQRKCSMALDAYIALAKQGCELLSRVEDLPLPEHQRNEILSHRRLELHAHSDYTKARSKLWASLNRV